MMETFACGDTAGLISYLYDESDAGEREAIAAHVAACASCARELASLSGTRRQLAAWKVPNTALGFRVSSEITNTPVQPWWRQPLPGWMQMAAAVAIFATGLALGVARGTTEDGTVSLSSNQQPPAAVPVSAVSPGDLTDLEARLRAEITRIRAAAPAEVKAVKSTHDDDAVLTQVRALLQESEERQRRELALRTAQMMRDVENQRRIDLAQVQQTWGQLQGVTGAEVQQQRELLNALARRVSLQR